MDDGDVYWRLIDRYMCAVVANEYFHSEIIFESYAVVFARQLQITHFNILNLMTF